MRKLKKSELKRVYGAGDQNATHPGKSHFTHHGEVTGHNHGKGQGSGATATTAHTDPGH